MPSTPLLVITDGTTRISLHNDVGLYLRDWRPGRPADKKVRREPVFGGGGQVVMNEYGNVVDTFDIGLRGHCQDYIITDLQNADRLLQKAINYWASTWTNEPVWLEARGPEETNTRYAVIKDYAVDGLANPYSQPFFAAFAGAGAMNELVLAIEHDIWQADEPGTATCVELYHTQDVTSPVEILELVEESTDDCYTDDGGGGSISLAGTDLIMGADAAGDSLNVGLVFTAVAVPAGATILSAYVQFQCSVAGANNTVNLRIYGEDNATPATFSTYADYTGRVTTTAYVDWLALPAWVLNGFYYSPNIASVIQEIIDLPGWASGNDLCVLIKDHPTSPSSNNANRTGAAWDHAALNEPAIYITYSTTDIATGVIAADATCEDTPYIVNYHAGTVNTNAQGITHAYTYDSSAGTYSANLLTAALPVNLFPNPVGNGDYLYIGAVDTAVGALDDKNVFTNVVFEIGTAAVYTAPASTTWTYWNGAAWAALAFHDETGSVSNVSAFSRAGTHSLHFNLPSNWAPVAVGPVWAYWIRCEVTIGGGGAITVPTQATRDLYACRWGCVDIDDEQVLGDIPALAQWKIHCRSDYIASDHLPAQHGQIVMGLRTEARGSYFSAFIPCASDMTIYRQSHTYSSPGAFTTTEAADYRSPYGGLVCQYVGGGAAHSMQRFYEAYIRDSTSPDFVGTYHMFVRYRRDAGATGDLIMGNGINIAWNNIYSRVTLQQTGNIEVADFGRVTIGGGIIGRPTDMGALYINLWMECTVAAARNCYVYDIILIPADEWYCKASVNPNTGDLLSDDRYLDIDSVLTPKDRRKCIVRAPGLYSSNNVLQFPWVRQGAGPAILQANATQRLWFFSFQPTTLTPPTGNMLGTFPLSASLRSSATARYLAMRGSR